MLRKLTYLIIGIGVSAGVYAQSDKEGVDDYVLEEDEYAISFDSLKTKDKIHYNFEVGAGFGRSSTYGNYFSTYYKPTISYDVSPRFSVITGLTYVNSSVDNIPVITEQGYQVFSGNISQYYAFVGGQYKLTDKLSVGGSLFYDFTSYNTFDGQELNNGSGIDNIGYSANFKYKVSKSMTIQGEIRVNDKNPYNQNSSPFSSGFMGMGGSMFGR